ncbi:MAG: type III polyketide synthase [Acidobacteria bacterium]|nr:type III polyketide synthase [Acidobacteriota bacterium]
MPHIAATSTAFPPHYYSQTEIAEALLELTAGPGGHRQAVRRFSDAVSVHGRYLALPIAEYMERPGFGRRNDAWIQVALELGETAVRQLLARATVEPDRIGLFATTTVTGLAVPSLEARLMNRLSFSPATKRLPLFGLGCVAGAAGVARVADYLRAFPDEAAILLSVELCSLTLQYDDPSVSNIIASGLFGDGAAAVLLVGDAHPLAGGGDAEVVATEACFFPDTERVMGWDIVDSGFRIVLSSAVPALAECDLAEAIRAFLATRQLTVPDIDVWIAHPGGPAVIDGMQRGLGLDAHALDRSRACLQRIGNLSSASVLVILDEVLQDATVAPRHGLLLAMGPGFCAELVLLRWPRP